MELRDTVSSFGKVSIANHWITAVLIIGLLCLGWYVEDLPKGPEKAALIGWHKSFGLTVLILSLFRIYWRRTSPTPAPLGQATPVQLKVATSVQHVLYAAIALMPLTGWLMSSSAGRDVSFFEMFTLPPLFWKSEFFNGVFHWLHSTIAIILVIALVLHIAAALKHHFLERNDTLNRMLGKPLQAGSESSSAS
jgi:cytochrome b561